MRFLPLIALAAAMCAGCAPLQQAPLVYSSKVTLGVDISTTSTESPGVALNLGYKQLDAAYVPVAVAKKCEVEKPDDCKDNAFDLKVIFGQSEVQGTTNSGTSTEVARARVQQFDNVNKRLAAAILEKTAIEESIAAAKKAKDELTKRSANETERLKASEANNKLLASLIEKRNNNLASADELRKIESLQASINNSSTPLITAQETAVLAELPKKIQDAEQIKGAKEKEVALISAESERLKPEALTAEQQLLEKTTRKDAYSVYGRFDGATSAEANKASVSLGKVFSTGVASQSISAGLGSYYEGLGLAACYEAVAKLASTVGPEHTRSLTADCRRSTVNTLKPAPITIP